MSVMTRVSNQVIIDVIHSARAFDDYRGMYFFGPRTKEHYSRESDFDVLLLFDEFDFQKKLQIAGIIGDIEYRHDVCIDYKLLATTGKRSIRYLRTQINPYFIHEAVDKGIFYETT